MIHLLLLGGLDLRASDGRELDAILAQPRRTAVLVYLAMAKPHGFRTRDTLMSIFWPEHDQTRAGGALRQALWFLRKELGGPVLVNRGGEVGIRPGMLDCDAISFEELCAAAKWHEALALYRGDLLPGFFASDMTPEFEQWLDGERSRLRGLAQQAARQLCRARDTLADNAGAMVVAHHWLTLAPYDEEALCRVVALLDRAGDRAGALHVFDEFAHRLRRDYDLSPSPDTLALLQSVRTRSEPVPLPVLTVDAPAPVPVTTLPSRAPSDERPIPAGRPHRSRPLVQLGGAVGLFAISVALLRQLPGSEAGVRTLAVVPPASLVNSDPLTTDITENLIASLSRLPELRVLAFSSVQRFKSDAEPSRIAQELGADIALAWRARGPEDSLRIQVELVDARRGARQWGETYARAWPARIGIENEIALDVAKQLRHRLTAEQQKRLSHVGTTDAEAYRLYRQGRLAWAERTAAGMRTAIRYFEQAIERDPDYAEAFAGIADCYIVMGRQAWLPPHVAFPAARHAAQRALAIDSLLAEAHASLGVVLNRYDWDRAASLHEFERAIQLSPSYATAWQWYAITLESVSRSADALAASERALQLDPLSPMVRTSYGDRLFFTQRYAEAMQQYRYVLAVDPAFFPAHVGLGAALLETDDIAGAIAEFDTVIDLSLGTRGLDRLAYAYAVGGRQPEAREILRRLEHLSLSAWVSPAVLAEIYAALGETDRAFSLLEQAVNRRDDELVMLRNNPRFRRLHSDPRFHRLLKMTALQ